MQLIFQLHWATPSLRLLQKGLDKEAVKMERGEIFPLFYMYLSKTYIYLYKQKNPIITFKFLRTYFTLSLSKMYTILFHGFSLLSGVTEKPK